MQALHETSFGTRDQRQGASGHVGQDVEASSWSSYSWAEQASPGSTADDRAQTHAEHVKDPPSSPLANRSQLKKAATSITVVQEHLPLAQRSCPRARAGQADTEDIHDFETKGGFRGLTSAGKLQVLKSKLPLETLMSEIHLGRSERAVRACLTKGILDKGD